MPLPDWLLWLLPVPVATLAAIAWASWSSRARGPQRPADSVQDFERFRAAMGGTVPPPCPQLRDSRETEPDTR